MQKKIFLQDKENLSHMYNDHCASDDISFETFSKYCSHVWNENKHNFVTIDLTQPVNLLTSIEKIGQNSGHFFTTN